ncbi:hypothetical protein EVAR_8542_1 [Eumeta japonica]|uniref:Mariner Mos1 transposase n=1 Tax=Eumeta variegata TaxID=151549 RepID=A0A4C1TYP6_EUMVA|nr:hypothetical protein EVAR_8542_1 [Eumeta japonica]
MIRTVCANSKLIDSENYDLASKTIRAIGGRGRRRRRDRNSASRLGNPICLSGMDTRDRTGIIGRPWNDAGRRCAVRRQILGTHQMRLLLGSLIFMENFVVETKSQCMTWKRLSSPTPKKFKASRSSEKTMNSLFWDSKEIVMIEYLDGERIYRFAVHDQFTYHVRMDDAAANSRTRRQVELCINKGGEKCAKVESDVFQIANERSQNTLDRARLVSRVSRPGAEGGMLWDQHILRNSKAVTFTRVPGVSELPTDALPATSVYKRSRNRQSVKKRQKPLHQQPPITNRYEYKSIYSALPTLRKRRPAAHCATAAVGGPSPRRPPFSPAAAFRLRPLHPAPIDVYWGGFLQPLPPWYLVLILVLTDELTNEFLTYVEPPRLRERADVGPVHRRLISDNGHSEIPFALGEGEGLQIRMP